MKLGLDYIQLFEKMKSCASDLELLFQLIRICLNSAFEGKDEFIEKDKYECDKQGIADYYGISTETLANWVNVFITDRQIKELFFEKSKVKITYNQFKILADTFGYSKVFVFFRPKNLDQKVMITPVNYIATLEHDAPNYEKITKLIESNNLKIIEYRAYNKGELLLLMGEDKNNSVACNTLNEEIKELFEIDPTVINLFPPKQSLELLGEYYELNKIENGKFIFDLPKNTYPEYKKSSMSFRKKGLKLIQHHLGMSDYEFKKFLSEHEEDQLEC